jgi:hypothetical protein
MSKGPQRPFTAIVQRKLEASVVSVETLSYWRRGRNASPRCHDLTSHSDRDLTTEAGLTLRGVCR